MLQSIREYTQGWIAGIVISVIILSFALWGIHSYFATGGDNQVVAVVDGVDINKDQLVFAYQRIRRQVQNQANHELLKNDAALRKQALKSVIDIEVLKQASMAQGFYVSDDQIDIYLQNMSEFQDDGQFSVDRFNRVLASSMLDTSGFLELIKTTLLIDQPKLGIVFSSFALPDETMYTVSLINQERQVEYLLLPIDIFIGRAESAGAVDIKKYYQDHINEFMQPERVSLDYIELSMADLKKNEKVTESILHRYYQENLNNYTQPKRWKLVDIVIPITTKSEQENAKNKALKAMQALKTGESYQKVVKQYGEGQLESGVWLSLNQVPSHLQHIVPTLDKAGTVSKPFRSKNAYIIVMAVDVREPSVMPYGEVKDRVKQTYLRQKSEEKFLELREQLANTAYEHPESLKAAAETVNLPIKQTELFSKDNASNGISEFANVRKVAFSEEVMVLRNNSDVIQLDPSRFVVIRVKSHVRSAAMPISSVSSQIEKIIKRKRADALIAKFTKSLTTQLNAGVNFSALTESEKFKWKDLGFIGRYTNDVDPAILDLAFRIPQPNKLPTYGSVQLPDGSFVIALVKAVRDGKIANKNQYKIFAEQVQNSDGLLEYELYRQSQIKAASIKVYDQ